MVNQPIVDAMGMPLRKRGSALKPAEPDTFTSYGAATLAPHEQLTVTLDGEHIARTLSDFNSYPQPIATGHSVLLLMIPPPDKLGNVQMADETKDRMQKGSVSAVVVHIGPDAYRDRKRFPGGPWVKEGDLVITPRYGGQQFQWYGGHRLATFFDDQLFLRMPRPGAAETDPTIVARRKRAAERTAGATAPVDAAPSEAAAEAAEE